MIRNVVRHEEMLKVVCQSAKEIIAKINQIGLFNVLFSQCKHSFDLKGVTGLFRPLCNRNMENDIFVTCTKKE